MVLRNDFEFCVWSVSLIVLREPGVVRDQIQGSPIAMHVLRSLRLSLLSGPFISLWSYMLVFHGFEPVLDIWVCEASKYNCRSVLSLQILQILDVYGVETP